MRVLVTGAGGQLGRALRPALTAHDATFLARADLDVTDAGAVRAAIEAARPEAIIHAAAWTDVDACEADPERAMAVNGTAVGHVARAAGDALVVLVSTDYVFDGATGRPFSEGSTPHPIQAYGRSKVAGERAVTEAARWAVARSAWVYNDRTASGEPARNFVLSMLRAAQTGEVAVVTDQIGSPTSARDLAAGLVAVVEAGASGAFHVVNEGACSRYDLARAAVAAAGMDAGRVVPTTTADAPARPAARPAFAPLATAAWHAAGFDPLPAWDAALATMIDDLVGAL